MEFTAGQSIEYMSRSGDRTEWRSGTYHGPITFLPSRTPQEGHVVMAEGDRGTWDDYRIVAGRDIRPEKWEDTDDYLRVAGIDYQKATTTFGPHPTLRFNEATGTWQRAASALEAALR